MDENFQENLIRALEEMNTNQSALSFIENAKESNPLQLFLLLSQMILNDSVPLNIVSNCVVLMSSILRPTIARPLDFLTNEFRRFDATSYNSIKQSLFRCLTLSTPNVRLSAARCIGFFAKIEFPRRKWPDVFDQLEALVTNTQNFGEWAPIGAISAMREIISEVNIWPRLPIFQSAKRVIINSCFEMMSKPIYPELKIEIVKCLQKAIPIFIQFDQGDHQFYQKLLELIISHIQIDNDKLHQELFLLLSTFLIKIYKILNSDMIGQIFTSILPDLASENETRQLHVILLCQDIARYEKDIFQQGFNDTQICFTELFERNFDQLFLKIIANGDFSDFDEAESIWVTQNAALDTLYIFGSVFSEQLFQDCVTFYETYKCSEVMNILLSALCAVQVITTIQTDEAVTFIASNVEYIFSLCGREELLIRASAFSVLQSVIKNKATVLFNDQQFTAVLQIVRFGLSLDLKTARHALAVFIELCKRFEPSGENPFLGINYPNVMEILTAAQQRPDAFVGQFIENVSDAIFIYVQHLPKVEICFKNLIDYLKIVLDHFVQCAGSSHEDRQKECDLCLMIGIIQVLEDEVIPYGSTILSTLLQSMTININSNADQSSIQNQNSFGNNDSSIILTISQIVFYIGEVALPFIEQMVSICESAQMSESPSIMNTSASLIGNIVVKMGRCLLEMGESGVSIVQRLFQLVFDNLAKIQTLPSSVSPLIFALSDIVKGIASCNPESARQFVSPLMNICTGYVKNLEFYVNLDFEAANSIADALMDAFTVIIDAFPTEVQFISENLKPVFIQVPIVVWEHKMLTRRTVENFISLMLRLIRNVGRKMNAELNNIKLREFLKYAYNEQSPYKDLIPMANTVKKFYLDI